MCCTEFQCEITWQCIPLVSTVKAKHNEQSKWDARIAFPGWPSLTSVTSVCFCTCTCVLLPDQKCRLCLIPTLSLNTHALVHHGCSAASSHQKQKENDDMDVPGVYCYTAVYTSALWEHKSFMIKQSIEKSQRRSQWTFYALQYITIQYIMVQYIMIPVYYGAVYYDTSILWCSSSMNGGDPLSRSGRHTCRPTDEWPPRFDYN